MLLHHLGGQNHHTGAFMAKCNKKSPKKDPHRISGTILWTLMRHIAPMAAINPINGVLDAQQ